MYQNTIIASLNINDSSRCNNVWYGQSAIGAIEHGDLIHWRKNRN